MQWDKWLGQINRHNLEGELITFVGAIVGMSGIYKR